MREGQAEDPAEPPERADNFSTGERSARTSQESGAKGDAGEDSRTSKKDLAENRTEWAQERTLLAKQRTFGAWTRTGLAIVAVGFGAAQFLGDLQPRWLIQLASGLLMMGGAITLLIGFFAYRDTFRKLEREGVHGIPTLVIAGITGTIAVGALILFLVIILQ